MRPEEAQQNSDNCMFLLHNSLWMTKTVLFQISNIFKEQEGCLMDLLTPHSSRVSTFCWSIQLGHRKALPLDTIPSASYKIACLGLWFKVTLRALTEHQNVNHVWEDHFCIFLQLWLYVNCPQWFLCFTLIVGVHSCVRVWEEFSLWLNFNFPNLVWFQMLPVTA